MIIYHTKAVVLGRCVADMLNSIVGLAIMIVAGLLLGWRWNPLSAITSAIRDLFMNPGWKGDSCTRL
jgi:ABC-2 type transport system permease protein